MLFADKQYGCLTNRCGVLIAIVTAITAVALGAGICPVHSQSSDHQRNKQQKILSELELRLAQGEFAEANSLAKQGLAISKQFDPQHVSVGYWLFYVADTHDKLGNKEQAESDYRSALRILAKTLSPNDPFVAGPLYGLARIYQGRKQYDAAEPLFQRVLGILSEHYKQNDARVVQVLQDLGWINYQLERHPEGDAFYDQSSEIAEKLFANDPQALLDHYFALAQGVNSWGRFDRVDSILKKQLEFAKKNFEADSQAVASVLKAYAAFLLTRSRYAEAEPLYKEMLQINEKKYGADHVYVAYRLGDLALTLEQQGRIREAEALYLRSILIHEKADHDKDDEHFSAIWALADNLRKQKRFPESETQFWRALNVANKASGISLESLSEEILLLADQSKQTINLLLDISILYQDQEKLSQAEDVLRKALSVARERHGSQSLEWARPAVQLARVLYGLGRDVEANEICELVFSIREQDISKNYTGSGLQALARQLMNQGQLRVLQHRFAEAEIIHRRALEVAKLAFEPRHTEVSTAHINLAEGLFAQEKWADAMRESQRAIDVLSSGDALDRNISGGLVATNRKSFAAQFQSWSAMMVRAAFRAAQNNPAEMNQIQSSMFERVQLAVDVRAASALSLMAARQAATNPALIQKIRKRQDLALEWQKYDNIRLAALTRSSGKEQQVESSGLWDRIKELQAQIARIDDQVALAFPDYQSVAAPNPLSIADVQANLHKDEALIAFFDTDDTPRIGRMKPFRSETYVWVITKQEVQWLRSDLGTTELQREVVAIRCGLDATAWHGEGALRCANLLKLTSAQVPKAGDALPFDARRAHDLYKGLLGEAAELIRGKHLLVVPSGVLTTLPFQVLVSQPPASKSVIAIRWLIHDHAITVLPSVASLNALRRVGKPSAALKPMIGFANPLLDGNQADVMDGPWYKQQAERASAQKGCAETSVQRTAAMRTISRSANPVAQSDGIAEPGHLRRQSPLPETADEICDVARLVGADPTEMRIGALATETIVKRLSATGDLAKYRIVHFATHGLLAGQLTGTREPGLILTPPVTSTSEDDGYLSGSEIAGLKLDADWVILSACNTAGGAGEGEAAEALSGLARVFFFAGARALLVSHWEVDSDAAVKLVSRSVGELAKDKSIGRAEALRRAMLAAMADTSRPSNWVPAWHPSVWAPFVVVGEGGAGR